jgi:hypothetical protein
VFLAAFAFIFLVVVAAGALRLGTNGWAALSIGQRVAVFASLAASAVILAASMVRQMVPGSRHTVPPAALPVGILLALMLVIATAFRSHGELAFVADGLVCMRNGLTYSVPAALLFWLLLRRGAILSPKLIGAAAGGLAGLTGLSVLEVNCPNLRSPGETAAGYLRACRDRSPFASWAVGVGGRRRPFQFQNRPVR